MQFFRLSFITAIVLGFQVLSQGGVPRRDSFANLPLRFEENRGQASRETGFIARGPNYLLSLEATGNRLTWTDAKSKQVVTVGTKLSGANPRAHLEALEPLPSRTNYFLGSSASDWRASIANYGKVRSSDVYPGIDLVFYGSAGTLEYDFIVRPGADPRRIEFQITGVPKISVTKNGDLLLGGPAGEVRWKKPVLYQTIAGRKQEVQGSFAILPKGRITFRVGKYQHSEPLIIDPVLSYLSYFGGIGNELPRAVATDAAGNVYIAGLTSTRNLPVSQSAVQPNYGGETTADYTGDAFVAKLSPAGALLYVTYVGGSGDDAAAGIAVDANGNAYITGFTNSTNFPVTQGVLQSQFAGLGGNNCHRLGDAFVVKLNPSGTQLIYSTYLGGSQDDAGAAIAIDAAGNAYISGTTLSANFPTTKGVPQATFAGSGGQPGEPSCNNQPLISTGDAFVAKLNPGGTQLVFSTFLGGSKDDAALAIGIDSAQNVYVAGQTLSANFPTTPKVLQNNYKGVDPQNEFDNHGDGFVTKLNSAGTALLYSTYLGGSGDDVIYSIFVDSGGTAYVAGSTTSTDFPVTAQAVQKTYQGYFNLPFLVSELEGDGFVTRLNPTGTAALYSTYLGGSANDIAYSVVVDASGFIYVAGSTDSTDFPITSDAAQRAFAGDGGEADYTLIGDGFLTIVDPGSTKPVYSTFLGGNLDDQLGGLAFDPTGNLWIVGNTVSTNLKVMAGAAQATYGGFKDSGGDKGDAMLVKFTGLPTASTGPRILTDGTGVINGGSYLPGGVVSGSWVSIKGSGFTEKTMDWSAFDFSKGVLPTSLNGVQVLFNGQPGYVWYLIAGNPQQVNVQAPANLSGSVTVQVIRDNVASNTVTTTAVQSAPAIYAYTLDNGATFYPSAVFLDATILGNPTVFPASRKASPGDKITLFADSLAPAPAGLVSVSSSVDPVTVTIGTAKFAADFAGLVAPGLFQINITAPNLPTGNYPVTIQISGQTSQPGVIFPYK